MSKFLIIYSSDNVEQLDVLTEEILQKAKDGNFKVIDVRGNQPLQTLGNEWRGINNYSNKDVVVKA